MWGIGTPQGTREGALVDFQTAVGSHTLGEHLPAERVEAALARKIEFGSIDYAWGENVRTAFRRYLRFLSPRERSQRMQRLRPPSSNGITSFL